MLRVDAPPQATRTLQPRRHEPRGPPRRRPPARLRHRAPRRSPVGQAVPDAGQLLPARRPLCHRPHVWGRRAVGAQRAGGGRLRGRDPRAPPRPGRARDRARPARRAGAALRPPHPPSHRRAGVHAAAQRRPHVAAAPAKPRRTADDVHLGSVAMEGGRRQRGAVLARKRGSMMLEDAVERSRPRIIAERLRENWSWFAQAALATSAAWLLAQHLFGHERPIFAPVAALIGVSASLGQRRRAAVEMVIGIALGIGIAAALVSLIGDGPLQIAVVVTLAMVAAVALGGSTALVSEAAASALLVVTIQLPGSGLSGVRFLDSLLGGVVALVVTSVLPRNPVVSMRRAVAPLLGELAAVLEEVARALERRDADVAERALDRARAIDPGPLQDAIAAGREMLQLAPFRSGTRAHFARYASAAEQIDASGTSVEALARAALRAIDLGDNAPAPVPDALRELAEAVR